MEGSVQVLLQGVREGGLTRTREACEPDDFAFVSIEAFPVCMGDAERLPVHVLGAENVVADHVMEKYYIS